MLSEAKSEVEGSKKNFYTSIKPSNPCENNANSIYYSTHSIVKAPLLLVILSIFANYTSFTYKRLAFFINFCYDILQ